MNKMYNHLKNNLRWTDRNIAAVMGNIMQESAFNYGNISTSGATGAFLFLGDRKKDYEKWIKDNGYRDGGLSLASYLNYIIENKIDPRMDAYNNAKKLLLNKNKVDSINANDYLNKVEPQIKNGTFYPISELAIKWNDPTYSLNDMTILWSNTIEKPGKHEANLKQRIDYANKFYNMIVPKKQTGGSMENRKAKELNTLLNNRIENSYSGEIRLEAINKINDWAVANPTRVLGGDFYLQRLYLTEDTWRKIVPELNLTEDLILKDKRIPDFIKSSSFNNSIRKAQNKVAKVMAPAVMAGAAAPLLALAAPLASNVGNVFKFGLTNPVVKQLGRYVAPRITGMITKELPVTAKNILIGTGEAAFNAEWIPDAVGSFIANPLDPSNSLYLLPYGFRKLKRGATKAKNYVKGLITK